jgi:hypothetical protein
VPPDEDGIGSAVCCDRIATIKEIAHVDVDAGSPETVHVFVDNGLALRTYLKSFYLEMRKLQTGLDRYAASTKTDVP